MDHRSPAGVFPRLGLSQASRSTPVDGLTGLDLDDLHALRHEALLAAAAIAAGRADLSTARWANLTTARVHAVDTAVTAELVRRGADVPDDVCSACSTELRGEWRWPHRCPGRQGDFDPANSRDRAAIEQGVWRAHADGVTDPALVLERLAGVFPGLSQQDLDAVPHLWGLVHDGWAEPIPAGLDAWADAGFSPSAAAQWDRAGVWSVEVALECTTAGIGAADACRPAEPQGSWPDPPVSIGAAVQNRSITLAEALDLLSPGRSS